MVWRDVAVDMVWLDVAVDMVWRDVAVDMVWRDVAVDMVWLDVAVDMVWLEVAVDFVWLKVLPGILLYEVKKPANTICDKRRLVRILNVGSCEWEYGVAAVGHVVFVDWHCEEAFWDSFCVCGAELGMGWISVLTALIGEWPQNRSSILGRGKDYNLPHNIQTWRGNGAIRDVLGT